MINYDKATKLLPTIGSSFSYTALFKYKEKVIKMNTKERFLTYVSFDTQSDSSSQQVPSTAKQLKFAEYLTSELKGIGIHDAETDCFGYVYAHIPASKGCSAPALALIAHMDTATDMTGANIHPRVVENYDGTDIVLNKEKNIVTKVSTFPALNEFIGQDLIVTDGTTLLGADDKAGIAEIMSLAEYLINNPAYPHPKICILFTPDEEIGRGADHVDIQKLGASIGYTVDGGILGEFSYENFNAAEAIVTLNGITAHPGYAKGVLRNSLLLAMEYQALLPVYETPACTQDREGFFHLCHMDGNAEKTTMKFMIRDHDYSLFQKRQQVMTNAISYLNQKYGEETAEIQITENYLNMYEKVKDHTELIDHVFEAMKEAQVVPRVNPVRGGTDGSRLSYMGLACPNLCTGAQNGHGRHEFVSVQAMDRVVEILKNLVALFSQEE